MILGLRFEPVTSVITFLSSLVRFYHYLFFSFLTVAVVPGGCVRPISPVQLSG